MHSASSDSRAHRSAGFDSEAETDASKSFKTSGKHRDRIRVVATGTGVISCAGLNSQELWDNVINGKSKIINDSNEAQGFSIGPVPLSSLRLQIAELQSAHPVSNPENSALLFSLLAIHQAMTAAGWSQLNDTDGLILATTTGQIRTWDESLIAYLRQQMSRQEFDQVFVHQPLGKLLDAIADHLQFSGRCFLTSTACTASTQALALGREWIAQGRVKRCLVVGTEVLCRLTLEGFKSLQLLSDQTSKPFDAQRRGINLSEGSAAICLEPQTASIYGNALAVLTSSGLTTDSYHMTAPQPQGTGCRDAILRALKSSDLQPRDISWIHAHGTGSPHNDSAEGAAILSVFGEDTPPVSSTKGIHGHALGASGAIESIVCIHALTNQMIPGTFGLKEPDSLIKVNINKEPQALPLKHILKLTLGFGGANAALILSRAEPQDNASVINGFSL